METETLSMEWDAESLEDQIAFLIKDHKTLPAASADRNPVGSLFIMHFKVSSYDVRFHNRLLC